MITCSQYGITCLAESLVRSVAGVIADGVGPKERLNVKCDQMYILASFLSGRPRQVARLNVHQATSIYTKITDAETITHNIHAIMRKVYSLIPLKPSHSTP